MNTKFIMAIGLIALFKFSEEVSSGSPAILYPNEDGFDAVAIGSDDCPDVPVEETQVHFYLFTRASPTKAEELFVANFTAENYNNFIDGAPVKIIVHGYINSYEDKASDTIKQGYTNSLLSNPNVILVDWQEIAWLNYCSAALKTKFVGEQISEFINVLTANSGTNLGNVHLIGHGLGAHVCGFAGKNLLNQRKVGRITGLNPAAQLFQNASISERLHVTDADFVDIIHTEGGLGIMEPIGKADFYPNGGKEQPGCIGLTEEASCNHNRAYEYFTESINNNNFKACKCPSYEVFTNCDCTQLINMGESTATSASGYYCFKTNSAIPFGKGDADDAKCDDDDSETSTPSSSTQFTLSLTAYFAALQLFFLRH